MASRGLAQGFDWRIEIPVIAVGLLAIALAAGWAHQQNEAARKASDARQAAVATALAIESAAKRHDGDYSTLDGTDQTGLERNGGYSGPVDARIEVHAQSASWCAEVRVSGASGGWSESSIRSGQSSSQKGKECP